MSACGSKVSSPARSSRPSALRTRQQLYFDAEENIRDEAARERRRRRLGSISGRNLEVDLRWERRATQRAEQMASTWAAGRKIAFKNGQYGPASCCAAASTWPGSSAGPSQLRSAWLGSTFSTFTGVVFTHRVQQRALPR